MKIVLSSRFYIRIGAIALLGMLIFYRHLIFSLVVTTSLHFVADGKISYGTLERKRGELYYTDFMLVNEEMTLTSPELKIAYQLEKKPWHLALAITAADLSLERKKPSEKPIFSLEGQKRVSLEFSVDRGIFSADEISFPFTLFSPDQNTICLQTKRTDGECSFHFETTEKGRLTSLQLEKCNASLLHDLTALLSPQLLLDYHFAEGEISGEVIYEKQSDSRAGRAHLEFSSFSLKHNPSETSVLLTGELAGYLPLSSDPLHDLIVQFEWSHADLSMQGTPYLTESKGSFDYCKQWNLVSSGKSFSHEVEIAGQGIVDAKQEQLLACRIGSGEIKATTRWGDPQIDFTTKRFDLSVLSSFFPKVPEGTISGKVSLRYDPTIMFLLNDVHMQIASHQLEEVSLDGKLQLVDKQLFVPSLQAAGEIRLPIVENSYPFALSIENDAMRLFRLLDPDAERPFLSVKADEQQLLLTTSFGVEGSAVLLPEEQSIEFCLQREGDFFKGKLEQIVLQSFSLFDLGSFVISGEEMGVGELSLTDLSWLKPLSTYFIPSSHFSGKLNGAAVLEKGRLSGSYDLSNFSFETAEFSCSIPSIERQEREMFTYNIEQKKGTVLGLLTDSSFRVKDRFFSHLDCSLFLDDKGMQFSALSLADPCLELSGKGFYEFATAQGSLDLERIEFSVAPFFQTRESFLEKVTITPVEFDFTQEQITAVRTDQSSASFILSNGDELFATFSSVDNQWSLDQWIGDFYGFSISGSSLTYSPLTQELDFIVEFSKAEERCLGLSGSIQNLFDKHFSFHLNQESHFFSRPLHLTHFIGGLSGVEQIALSTSAELHEIGKKFLTAPQWLDLSSIHGKVSLELNMEKPNTPSLKVFGQEIVLFSKTQSDFFCEVSHKENVWSLDELDYAGFSLRGRVEQLGDQTFDFRDWHGQSKWVDCQCFGGYNPVKQELRFETDHSFTFRNKKIDQAIGMTARFTEKMGAFDIDGEFIHDLKIDALRINSEGYTPFTYSHLNGLTIGEQKINGFDENGNVFLTLLLPNISIDHAYDITVQDIRLHCEKEIAVFAEMVDGCSPQVANWLVPQMSDLSLSLTASPKKESYSLVAQFNPHHDENWISLQKLDLTMLEGKPSLTCAAKVGLEPVVATWKSEGPTLRITDPRTKEDLMLSFASSSLNGIFKGIRINAGLDSFSEENIVRCHFKGDFARLHRLLPEKMREKVGKLHLGGGLELSGKLVFEEKTPASFTGKLQGMDFDLYERKWSYLQTDIAWSPSSICLDNVTIDDPAASLKVKKISLEKNAQEQWLCHVPLIAISNFRPGILKKNQEVFNLRRLTLSDLSGKLGDINSFRGKGFLSFTNAREKTIWDIPRELTKSLGLDPSLLTPIVGDADLELENGKFYLFNLTNSYSEGKRSRFFLAKGAPSYFDLEGNLSIDLKMKQNVLLKVTEPFVLAVRGKMNKPEFSLK